MYTSIKTKVRYILICIVTFAILQLCGCSDIPSILLAGIYGTAVNMTIDYCKE